MKWRERRTTRCTLVALDGCLLSLGEQGQLRLMKLDPTRYAELARWEVPGLSYPAWAPPRSAAGGYFCAAKAPTVPASSGSFASRPWSARINV